MQFIDRHTNAARINRDVRPLIDGILNNRRIFDADQDDPPFVTEAVKYRSEKQQRRQTSPYDGSDEFVQEIIDFFGFDPLDFQVESWQTVEELHRERRETGENRAAVFSAPTGFGKTEAFLGPLYQLLREGRQESTAIVYPSRALLQDQLGRVLEHVHEIKSQTGDQLSVGVYVGRMPYEMSDVETNSTFFDAGGGRPRFRLANCWCGKEGSPNAFEYHGTSRSYTLQCEQHPEHSFTDQELVLSRKDMVFHNQPDILLTTLESLEGFALKPNYPLIDNIDTIVLDEVHLNTQLRGAHAAKIIQNINDITEQPVLWLGSSATIDDAARFGKQLFGVSSNHIRTVEPPESDFDDDHDDHEHYYFMLASQDGPGASSMSIQQHLLLGHSLLEDANGERGKMLAFIDSISQVNQKYTQLVDADHNRELWRYHLGGDDVEDWTEVAREMNHNFLDQHLSFLPVYSDRGFDSADVGNSDVLLSTSFLEVGIDVGEIKTITQYRTPWDLSSFKQRAGRAAREEGMDAHIAVMLSGLTGDANMFYRADRFLDSDIRTPLKTDNDVVEWIHGRFREYYEVASDVEQRNFRLEDPHEVFVEEYLDDRLGFDAYRRLLLSPSEFFDEELGVDVAPEPLLSEALVEEAYAALETYLDERQSEFEDIESFFGLDDGDVVRGEDAVDNYVHRVQDQVLKLVNSLFGQVSGYENELHALGASGYEADVAELESELERLRERASRIPDGDTQTKVQHFEGLLGDLFGLSGDLIKLQSQVNRASDEPIPSVRTDRLNEVQEAVTQLSALSDDDRIKDFYRTQKQVYYLQEVLDELEEYVSFGRPYLSLYAVRHLLRGGYYLDRFLQVDDRSLGEVWYVPPNYYGDSGRFFSVFQPDSTSSSDESIDKLVSTYAPYRSEYQSETNEMQAFLPHTEVTEDGVQFDFSRNVSGEVRDGILVPDSIELDSMTDLSGEAALNIVRYCPDCYQILSDLDNCLRHGKSKLGKIHSDAHVSTRIRDETQIDTTGTISLADITSEVALEGVTLNIRPAQSWGAEVSFGAGDPFEVDIDTPEETIGFQLDTRGLIFDMDSFLERVNSEEVREIAERYNDFEEFDYEYVAYHTAAHFFLQLVSDVSAVNTTMLFYGFDREQSEVYVFERTEGGQGIVDLVYDELESDPATVLEAVNRTAYNPQVINERLWADHAFVDRLPDSPEDEDAIEALVSDVLDIPYESVVDSVVQEVFSSVDKAYQFAADEGVELEEAYRVKRAIASEQVAGAEEFPTDAVAGLDVDISDADRAETVFFSPDIDGCVENLHLSECIATNEQSDSLSYVHLEALREEVVHTVPSDETSDEMFDRQLIPAGEFNDTSVFLDF
ncbi:DEAD/DEAH box helicase [Halobacterium sp. R2-5]|uniref:DEAD/DEAH box helicase n=1 Tax=Halobacterium sp. R2-5 TaxID=2715751 RepID=UPI00141F85AC|nr:DEAD/DEAH box helicase [Halobacterium sp. R2-5]NIC00937.1 DEAD/DEAH box helicase [Halobacterium sp. R2-5]